MRFMNEKDYNRWVEDMYLSFDHRRFNGSKGYITDGRFSNVFLMTSFEAHTPDTKRVIIMNIKTGKVAIARCSGNDEFNLHEGIAIAWAKYRNMEVPYKVEIIGIKDLKPNDYFAFSSNHCNKIWCFVGFLKNEDTNKEQIVFKRSEKSRELRYERLVDCSGAVFRIL